MTKIYYQILHLPLEDNGLYPDPSFEFYFRPWVNLSVEIECNSSMLQIPHYFLSPDEVYYYYAHQC